MNIKEVLRDYNDEVKKQMQEAKTKNDKVSYCYFRRKHNILSKIDCNGNDIFYNKRCITTVTIFDDYIDRLSIITTIVRSIYVAIYS